MRSPRVPPHSPILSRPAAASVGPAQLPAVGPRVPLCHVHRTPLSLFFLIVRHAQTLFSHSFTRFKCHRALPPHPLTAHQRHALPTRSGRITASPLITPMPSTGPEHGRSPSTAGFAVMSRLHPTSCRAAARYAAQPNPLAQLAPLSSLVLAPPQPQHLVGRCVIVSSATVPATAVVSAPSGHRAHAWPTRRVRPAFWAGCLAGG
jgi:hypothetical protein